MEDVYRIAWRSINGETGHGQYCLTLHMANKYLGELFKAHPDVTHWLEKKCAIPN